MTEIQKEKLRQIVSRTDKSGNEKVDMLVELMEAFAAQQKSEIKMPTEEEIVKEADARFTDRVTGFVHSDKRDGFIRCGRWILKLNGFATK